MRIVKIIETNITWDELGNQSDFQSRVIEVANWDNYVKEIKSGESKHRTSCIGNMCGLSLPRNTLVQNVKSDELHLSCHFQNGMGLWMTKLAYLIIE